MIRPRFTVRRLMLAVAIMAALLAPLRIVPDGHGNDRWLWITYASRSYGVVSNRPYIWLFWNGYLNRTILFVGWGAEYTFRFDLGKAPWAKPNRWRFEVGDMP